MPPKKKTKKKAVKKSSKSNYRKELEKRSRIKVRQRLPLTEKEKKHKNWTAQQCIEYLLQFCQAEELRYVTHQYFINYAIISDSTWVPHFGTFNEYRSSAAIQLSRQQRALTLKIARHASVDHYRELTVERGKICGLYERPREPGWVVMTVASDFHDIRVDPFFLRVWHDVNRHLQPQIIVYAGDMGDYLEFSRHHVDHRVYAPAERQNFLLDEIIKPDRENCPDAQIDWYEGNHEQRILKYFKDQCAVLMHYMEGFKGTTITELLGIDELEINYIAQADLATWKQSDVNRQLARNYAVYDEMLMGCHYHTKKKKGMPGFSGHYHIHKVWERDSERHGPYEWHQLGCGHRTHVDYCDASSWNMGFLIIRYKPGSPKSVHMNYIHVKDDDAFVEGTHYKRRPEEYYWLPEEEASYNGRKTKGSKV